MLLHTFQHIYFENFTIEARIYKILHVINRVSYKRVIRKYEDILCRNLYYRIDNQLVLFLFLKNTILRLSWILRL